MTRSSDYFPNWSKTLAIGVLLGLFAIVLYNSFKSGEADCSWARYKRSEKPVRYWLVIVLQIFILVSIACVFGMLLFGSEKCADRSHFKICFFESVFNLCFICG